MKPANEAAADNRSNPCLCAGAWRTHEREFNNFSRAAAKVAKEDLLRRLSFAPSRLRVIPTALRLLVAAGKFWDMLIAGMLRLRLADAYLTPDAISRRRLQIFIH
ncbi:MAG: hypothetical protein ACREH8_18315 [Opitutaceae bacterium]